MSAAELLQLVRTGDLDGFEALCLLALEEGSLQLADCVAAFDELEKRGQAERAATIAKLILEHGDADADPGAALAIARVALLGDPTSAELRERTIALYRRVYADRAGLDALLGASGLSSGRPARNAIRCLDVCLTLKPGDALLSRADGVVVEVLEVDLAHGLVTLRQAGRRKSITPVEVSREYEPLAPDDFRVLRALRPERLTELLASDPVAVVIGLIHAHGESIDQDMLKRELVPRYIPAREWPRWWSGTRAALERSPHVVLEGRAPVRLRYTAQAWTPEDAAWEAFRRQSGPAEWLAIVEGYLREKRRHKQAPDAALLKRCQQQVDHQRRLIQELRPAEALACALLSRRLSELAGDLDEQVRSLPAELLRCSADPADLIAGLPNEDFWSLALDVLPSARPGDAAARAGELLPVAPAGLLDRIVELMRAGGLLAAAQAHIDTALADPVDYPEVIFWLWRGPENADGLHLPADETLLARIVETLSALGRTLNPGAERMRRFRQRMRAALALRDYARAADCIRRTPADRAVTLRAQLERLEGVGDNTRLRLLSLLRQTHPTVFAAPRRRLEPWEDPDVLWNTVAGIRRKTEERDHLVNVTMRENARRIGEAAAHGDLSENSEYKFALEERDFLRARLAQMNHDLALARPIDPSRVPLDHVSVGARVTLRDVRDGTTRVMTFLGPFDTDVERGIYNYRAPLSLQLMGLRVGERKRLTFDDREGEYEVAEIANGLATGGGAEAAPGGCV